MHRFLVPSRRSLSLLLWKQAHSFTMTSSPQFPVAKAMEENLKATFKPTHLQVINESHRHNVPVDSETHFQVVVVSEQFENQTAIQRHRMIHAALAPQLQNGGVHALSIVAKTPQQWSERPEIEPTPNCRGGDGSLPPKQQPK